MFRKPAISLFALAVSTAAALAAEDKNSIDFTQVIKDQYGAPAEVEIDKDNKRDMTLGLVVATALLSEPPQDPHAAIEPVKKAAKAALAERLMNAKNESLTVQEKSLIEENVARIWAPLITYRVLQIIDPKAAELAAERK